MWARKRNFKTGMVLINKNVRLSIICIMAVMLAIMAIMILYTVKKGKFIEQKVPVYSYSNKAKVDYQTFLLPNSLYPANQKSIGAGNIYIKKITDYIETNLRYEFNGQAPAEIQGKYNIKAVMEGQLGSDSSKKTIWRYEEQLTPEQSFKINDSKYVVEAKSQIKPQKFDDIAKQKSSENDLSFDTKLTIYWDIQIEAKTSKGIVHEQLTPTMEIPINTEKYFSIKGSLTPEKKASIDTTTKVISPTYKMRINLYSSVIVIGLLVLTFLILGTSAKQLDSALQIKLKKIFKNHGDRLVQLKGENLLGAAQLLHVREFDDLVRIADDIGRPIFYKQNKASNDISTFYVFDEKYVYLLELNEAVDATVAVDGELEFNLKSGMIIRY